MVERMQPMSETRRGEMTSGRHRPTRNEFTAVIAPADEGGYWAYCLEIPAVGQGETVDACRANLRAAILLMLEDRRETERKEAARNAWEEVIEVVE
jgi:predicted RNase H-like HicB family nuclease